MHVLLHSVSLTQQQATTDPRLHHRLPDTHRQVWDSLLWGHCSFLLGPGAQGSVCAHQESISQSCVSSGSSVVELMATSSKRAYATPRSTAPRGPALWQAIADPYLHRRCSNTVLSQSLWGPGSWYAQGLFEPSEHLWQEWGLILNATLPLLPCCWGFSFALGRGVSPQICSNAYRPTGDSLTLDEGYLLLAGPAKHSCSS